MDSTPHSLGDSALPGTGELVVQAGRKKGIRRPLKSPVTFIGRDPHCDVRLDVEEILPVHCVITIGADGPHLRSCDPETTRVNNELVINCSLRNGDILHVGAFQFEICWTPPGPVEQEMQRVKISGEAKQSAADVPPAVVAQVEEKRKQILELHRQVGEARAAFRKERAEHKTMLECEQRDLAEGRDEADRRERQAENERQRLLDLRRKFLKRWKRHWSAERNRIEKETTGVRMMRDTLEQERSVFDKERAHHAAETASERRRLDESFSKLAQDRQNWQAEERRLRNERELARQRIDADAERLEIAERNLFSEGRRVASEVTRLKAEVAGLETRAQHGREQLRELEREKATFGTAPSALPLPGDAALNNFQGLHGPSLNQPQKAAHPQAEPPVPAIPQPKLAVPAELRRRSDDLDRLAAELADQRTSFAEQCEQLAMARDAWREEEQRVVGELEALTTQLREQEQVLDHREEALREGEEALRQQAERQRAQRVQLVAWQSRLAAEETTWPAEHERLRAELATEQVAANKREAEFAELTRRWSEERAAGEEKLREEHARCATLRRAWAEQAASIARQSDELHERQRRLAEQVLALERARRELVDATENPAVAEKRLERQKRHAQSAFDRSERFLVERRRTIEAEADGLQEIFERAAERIREATRLEHKLSDLLRTCEERELRVVRESAAHAADGESWRRQREDYEAQLARLRQEIGRLTQPGEEIAPESDTLPFPRAA